MSIKIQFILHSYLEGISATDSCSVQAQIA